MGALKYTPNALWQRNYLNADADVSWSVQMSYFWLLQSTIGGYILVATHLVSIPVPVSVSVSVSGSLCYPSCKCKITNALAQPTRASYNCLDCLLRLLWQPLIAQRLWKTLTQINQQFVLDYCFWLIKWEKIKLSNTLCPHGSRLISNFRLPSNWL